MNGENTEKALQIGGKGVTVVTKKVNGINAKIDGFVEKILGFLGDHPWEDWLKVADECIARVLPGIILIAGVCTTATGLVIAIKNDLPVSFVAIQFIPLVWMAFAMHLSPKALKLASSFVSKGESGAIRPELIYIVKVILGVGGILLAGCFALFGNFAACAVLLVLSLIVIIVSTRPALIGVKADYPTNAVSEVITILLVPLKAVLALLSIIIGIATIGGLVYGIIATFSTNSALDLYVLEYGFMGLGPTVLLFTTLLPLVAPFTIYVISLIIFFVFDFCRAIVSIPAKLDALKK
ncbi:MAG: hypothetical protein ACI4RA_01990 [Kiritimatiellia bacterium]